MAFTTKLNLIDQKFEQTTGGTLTLSGTTKIASTGKLEYSTNRSSYFDVTPRAVPDVAYVTGRTADLSADIQYISGKTSENIADIANLATWSGETTADIAFVSAATAANTADIAVLAAWSGETTADIAALGAISGITLVSITGVTNGLTKVGDHSAKLGGALTETTTIYGSKILNVNATTLNLTGVSGVYLTGEVFVRDLMSGNTIVTVNPATGQLTTTDIGTVGMTNATNGLTKSGSTAILGGTLVRDTEILGAAKDLSLGTAGSKLDLLNVNTSGNVGITSDANLVMSLSGGTITTADLKGLKYVTDYSTTFVPNSLVTKLYVDTVASGLDPKSAVNAATVSNITLSGTQTIDGVPLIIGDRVLVKNQTSGQTNGIYIVQSGTWTRATDFDGTPVGEVTEGALIPVLSGNTNINSSWILITPDPITIDTTPLTFTKFSQLLDVSPGDGIRIDTVGETKEINIQLASPSSGLEIDGSGDLKIDLTDNSGLQLLASGLTINPAIAGNALDWSAGVINVNIADVNTQLGGVLSATTNGLSETTTGIVELGGTLSKATTITSPEGVSSLTFDDTHTTAKVGILYGGDYSASFVDRSLVDKAYVVKYTTGLTSGLDSRLDVIEPIYVTGATGGICKSDAHTVSLTAANQAILTAALTGGTTGTHLGTAGRNVCLDTTATTVIDNGITGVTNGLTKVGSHNAKLGGDLIENTYINLVGKSLTITGGTITGGIYVSESTTNIGDPLGAGGSGSYVSVSPEGGAEIHVCGTDNNILICNQSTGGDIIINSGDKICLVATGITIQTTPPVGESCDSVLVWDSGDKLIKTLSVSEITGATAYNFTNGLTKVGQDVKLGGTQLSETTVIAGNSQVFSLTGLTDLNLGATTVDVTGTVSLLTTPASGDTATDSVLVRDASTGAIQQIPASSLGQDNNDYETAVVAASTGLTTTSPYAILVNSPAAAVILTLPATPFDGQAFRIKDVSGQALTYNITIDGGTYDIDNAGTATINTDYGALELLFKTGLNKWFVMSFVN